MKLICISGQFCSGKTMAVEILAEYLPNSAIVHGDDYFVDALLKHKNEFEEVYGASLDLEKPTASLRSVNDNFNDESVKTYIRFCNIFMPYIESKIEKAVIKNKEQGKDFIIVEYVSLPKFKMWESADFRIMISPNKQVREAKLYERTIAKREYNTGYELIRENAFEDIIRSANNIDFVINNNYDENFKKDLIYLSEKII